MKIQLLMPLILVGWLLSSCASWYDVKVDRPESYTAPILLDTNYNIDGRFTIKTPKKNYYGNFNWQHESGNDVLEFKSPLGNTAAKINIESGLATLRTDDEHIYSGTDLSQIMDEELGFSMPLQYLHYWIQGVPLPQYQVTNHLDSGFSQLGWQIEYLRWQDINHPHIVQLTKPNLAIKLLIDWSILAN